MTQAQYKRIPLILIILLSNSILIPSFAISHQNPSFEPKHVYKPTKPSHLPKLFPWQGEKHPVFLEAPILSSSFGQWFDWQFCEEKNTFVIGMRVRLIRGRLGGLKMFCGQPGTKKVTSNLDAGAGPLGPGWKPTEFCEGLATGFALRFKRIRQVDLLEQSDNDKSGDVKRHHYTGEPKNPADFDDDGATNFRLICTNFNETIEHPVIEDRETKKESVWLDPEVCYKNQGICGLQINRAEIVLDDHFEHHSSSEEEFHDTRTAGFEGQNLGMTTVRGIRVKCCDILDPIDTCIPSDKWQLTARYDNSDGLQKAQYSYTKKVGISKTGGTIEVISGIKNYGVKGLPEVMGSLGEGLKLAAKLGGDLGYSISTDFDWSKASSETWSDERASTLNLEIQPGYITELWQIVGVCGEYTVRPDKVFQTGSFSQKKQDRAAREGYERLSKFDKLKIMGLMITLMGLSNYLL